MATTIHRAVRAPEECSLRVLASPGESRCATTCRRPRLRGAIPLKEQEADVVKAGPLTSSVPGRSTRPGRLHTHCRGPRWGHIKAPALRPSCSTEGTTIRNREIHRGEVTATSPRGRELSSSPGPDLPDPGPHTRTPPSDSGSTGGPRKTSDGDGGSRPQEKVCSRQPGIRSLEEKCVVGCPSFIIISVLMGQRIN
ncbi:unnamed protein product [Gadus morhua 'NCC']